ncbi:MAG: hypothetical protein AAF664_17470 [Planctomycetota bacterium]
MADEPTLDDSTSRSIPSVFSAPRKLDLASAVVVTAAYAAVFALLRALGAPAQFGLFVIASLTTIALAQAALFQGKRPRLASAFAGTLSLAVTTMLLLPSGPNQFSSDALANIVISIVFWGSLWGYFAGIAIGSLFMLSHKLRSVLSRR